MSHAGITTLVCILFELIPLDRLICNAFYIEYHQDYFHEIIRFCKFCKRGRYNVSCIQNMAALVFIPPVTTTTANVQGTRTVTLPTIFVKVCPFEIFLMKILYAL